MQGLAPSSKLPLTIVVVVFLLGMAGAAHGLTRVVANSPDEPCMNMTLYYHDILYNGNNTANATTAAATKPTVLAKTYRKNSTYFGALMVFNDPMTVGKALPLAGEEPAARAQGFYFYDKQTRDFSVVGGTGDFFMARGVTTIRTDAIEGLYYFRLQMDIKLYECYL
ncbi:dirigent protein 5-like [Triticum dicoccoides]|uniref:dirigent protein 5-like n=1 Tax=Triticum dicoccoides TaxID=85692 RepID=UPI00188F5A92|nr:dirigent protein 5-like [Triticum dicoccoides]